MTHEFPDVCRLRLDFETFQLTAPTTVAPHGQCSTDVMTVRKTIIFHNSLNTTTLAKFQLQCQCSGSEMITTSGLFPHFSFDTTDA